MCPETRTPPVTLIRSADDVRAMAIAIQANLVQLKVADANRQGIAPTGHEIPVKPPGAVREYRETLIERAALKRYSNLEMALRLHEVWGQFCLMQWLFRQDPAAGAGDFAALAPDTHPRCGAVLGVKQAELEAFLWRLRFEQRLRREPDIVRSPRYSADLAAATRIPLRLLGNELADCTDDELLVGACEHAGMLATIRWVLDNQLAWGAPGIMEVGDQPFQNGEFRIANSE